MGVHHRGYFFPKGEAMTRVQLRTQRREEFVDVTGHVADAVRASGVHEGWALVYCPHTTAGITINENADPDVVTDVLAALRELAPQHAGWRHVEGNSDGHVKASLVGSSVTIPIAEGRLALGTWQGVYFCEFDGPRTRNVLVSVLGE
jgi:secondary thiamine-phosphate synthase enzyme